MARSAVQSCAPHGPFGDPPGSLRRRKRDRPDRAFGKKIQAQAAVIDVGVLADLRVGRRIRGQNRGLAFVPASCSSLGSSSGSPASIIAYIPNINNNPNPGSQPVARQGGAHQRRRHRSHHRGTIVEAPQAGNRQAARTVSVGVAWTWFRFPRSRAGIVPARDGVNVNRRVPCSHTGAGCAAPMPSGSR